MVLLLVACTGSPEPTRTVPPGTHDTATSESTGHTGLVPTDPLRITAGPTVDRPTSGDVRLVQILTVSTNRPTRATLVLDEGVRRRQIAFGAYSVDHSLPLLALLEDTSYDLDLTLEDESGEVASESVNFATEGLLDLMPTLQLRTHTPPIEPGYTLVPFTAPGIGSMTFALDEQARVVWALQPNAMLRALSFDPGIGTVSGLAGDRARTWTMTGDGVATWAPVAGALAGEIPVELDGFHHEVAFDTDGSFFTIHKSPIQVSAYPIDERDPSVLAPAMVSDEIVSHIAADGTVLASWSMATLLDETRIGFGSNDIDGGERDWGHGNAVVPLTAEDALLVSLRHQDAVVKIRQSTGALIWILGNPDGWGPEHTPYLLTPVGAPFAWQYHQHGPMVGPDGQIALFDNGNDFRTTPYSQTPAPGGLYSRVVKYEVDEAQMEVRQTLSFVSGAAPDQLYSQAFGNADTMPETGHVLSTFAFLHNEDGVDNSTVGLGEKSVRLVEIDPVSSVAVWDLGLTLPFADSADGVDVDRAIRVASLYPSSVVETWLDP